MSSQRRTTMRRAIPLLIVVILASLVFGCGKKGPPTYPVSGTVALADGTPLRGAVVKFRQSDKAPAITASGKTDDNGKFTLSTFAPNDGAMEGEYAIIVVAAVPRDMDNMTPAQRNRAIEPLDNKFLSYDTSGLKFKVTSDPAQNQMQIKVWPPRD